MTLSPETESLAERYARLSREGADRRGVDAALRSLDMLISATVLIVALPVLVIVTIVFLASVWYITLTTYNGARGISPQQIAVARSFSASPLQIIWPVT